MSVLEVDLSALFVVAVILIWFMTGYQFVLTLFGFLNFVRSLRERKEVEGKSIRYPTCTILIPAHNEEKVIGPALEAMLRLDYPAELFTVFVIADNCTRGAVPRRTIGRRVAMAAAAVRDLREIGDDGGGRTSVLLVEIVGCAEPV